MTAVHIWESESVLNIAGLKIYASPLQHHSLCESERERNANSCCHGDMNLMRIKNEINEEFALAWRCCLSVCPRGLSACSVCGCGHGQRGKHAFKTLLAHASRKKTQISSPHHWHTKTEVEISKCVCSNAELVGRETSWRISAAWGIWFYSEGSRLCDMIYCKCVTMLETCETNVEHLTSCFSHFKDTKTSLDNSFVSRVNKHFSVKVWGRLSISYVHQSCIYLIKNRVIL